MYSGRRKMCLGLLAIFEITSGGNGILEWLLWWGLGVTTHLSVLLQNKDRQRSGIEHPEDSTEAVYLGPAIMDVGLGGGDFDPE